MTAIRTAAPQLLVDDLAKSLAFYDERLGFAADFVYEGFYASVSRGGATIHLKCAPKLAGEREHRRDGEHLDAYVAVDGVAELYEELARRGAPFVQALAKRPWGALDFTVVDPDGHRLCFSQAEPVS